MSVMPTIGRDEAGRFLVVDGKPFLALGGELHNSSGSSLKYMDEFVWPALRGLGGNFYLTPAYWECLEPEKGKYDFTLIDGVIDQARREGVRLGLLWFGIWKNGASEYVPLWLKQDHEAYFLAKDENGIPIKTISPFCEAVVELDRKAFVKLMEHLEEVDGEEHTVILIQVENEIGIWGHARDFSDAANEKYELGVPEDLTALTGKSGSWKEAFGSRACDAFMTYYYAKDLEKIASSGKAAYNLPMFMNCVAGTADMGFSPAGGPDAHAHDLWIPLAPSIDFFSPDIYVPDFKAVASRFDHDDNPLFIPETGCGPDCPAKVLYAAGEHNLIGFNPFGIEQSFATLSDLDYASQGVGAMNQPYCGSNLARAYSFLQILWPEIRKAHAAGRIHGFMKGPQDFMGGLEMGGYSFRITYNAGSRGTIPGMPPEALPQSAPAPSGGFLMQNEDGSFLLVGTNISLAPGEAKGGQGTIFMQDKHELLLENGKLVEGRILNGDERNVLGIGMTPQAVWFRLDRH